MSRARAAFLFALLVCLIMTARQIHKPNLADFQVYDTAAALVHEHQSLHIYDDADTGQDPQLKFADPHTAFAGAARQLGIDRVRLYVYPPILADVIVPFALISASVGGKLWLVLNFAALVAIAALVAGILKLRIASLGAAALLIGLFALFSTGMCLIWGQVTILLLLLWTAGIYAYLRGWYVASGLVLALATVIKLTPLLVIVPFFIWRDWKWLRAYIGALAVCAAVICFVNTPASLVDYFEHVMPSMSGGIPNFENKSLLASVQLVYIALHGGNLTPVTMAVPKIVVTLGKACSLAMVLFAIALVYRLGPRLRAMDRAVTLALFALLSTCISPVSWKHAYIVGFLALAFLWAESLRTKVSTVYLGLLTLCSIELGSFFFDSVAVKVAHGIPLGLLSFLAPVAGILLVFSTLLRMRVVQSA